MGVVKQFILYSTSGCHLCEIAHGMIEQALAGRPDHACVEVDIADDDALFGRYGIRIPVLLHPDGRELGWPFDDAELDAFMSS